MSVIDLHCHVLPGIDDGPDTSEESLALGRAAVTAGTDTIVATPHVNRTYRNDAATINRLVGDLGARFASADVALELRKGAEIAMSVADAIAPDELSGLTLGGGPWLLIECPFTSLATGVDILVLKLQSQGYRVVLAHPERSPFFHGNTKLLGSLVRAGVLSSITAGSLTGDFGRHVQQFARRLVDEELVHNVASDAHNISSRPPGVLQAVENSGLARLADWLTLDVPAAMLAGDEIPARPTGVVPKGQGRRGAWLRKLAR